MYGLQQDVSEYAGTLKGCKDFESIRRGFHAAFDEIGFSRSIYVRFHLPEYDQLSSSVFSQQMVVSTNFPELWRDHYREQNYHRIDPVFSECRHSVTPQVWMDIWRGHELDTQQKQFFGESVEFGLPIPIHGPRREFAVVSLSADEPEASFMRRIKEHKHTAHILAIHLHAALQELLEDPGAPPVTLTPRERECLKWTARGKSSWVISEILSLSERTVNFHITNAMGKLDVTSRTHAVAKSLYHGLIEL
jgi:LuxR family transcriptional activator of conjugal transfer of Ti plasmids